MSKIFQKLKIRKSRKNLRNNRLKSIKIFRKIQLHLLLRNQTQIRKTGNPDQFQDHEVDPKVALNLNQNLEVNLVADHVV